MIFTQYSHKNSAHGLAGSCNLQFIPHRPRSLFTLSLQRIPTQSLQFNFQQVLYISAYMHTISMQSYKRCLQRSSCKSLQVEATTSSPLSSIYSNTHKYCSLKKRIPQPSKIKLYSNVSLMLHIRLGFTSKK